MNERTKELIQMADLCAAGLMASGATEEEIQARSKVVLADLVRADEREACAEVCDKYAEANQESDIMCTAFDHCAEAIRARGEK
jgi:hypothetical protein